MAIKSVIDIDINDAKFKEFAALFEKYQKSLGKMPGQWGKINSATNSLSGNFAKIQHALDTIASRLDKNYTTLKNSDEVVKKTSDHWQRIGKSSAAFTKNIAASTFNLLKWGSIGAAYGLLGAGGGLFGLGSLAGGASDQRKKSQGLGVTPGELKSAETAFSRYTDVSALLSGVATAQTTLEKQWAFGANQLNPQESSATLLPQLLRRAAEVYKAGPEASAEQRLQATGLDLLGIDITTARTYASLKEEEVRATEDLFKQNNKLLNINDKTLQTWQRLDVQLDVSKAKITRTFIEGLERLASPITKLSDSFSKAVETFMQSDQIAGWMDAFGGKIQELAEYMAKPEFKEDIKGFLEGLDNMGKAAMRLANFINGIATFGQGDKPTSGANPSQDQGREFLSKMDAKYGLPSGTMYETWRKESSYGKNNVGPITSNGQRALGPFQMMPGTQKEYGVNNPFDFFEAGEAMAKKKAGLLKYYKGDVQKAEAAYNWGEGNLNKAIEKASKSGGDWRDELPKETRGYIGSSNNQGGQSPGATQSMPVSWNPTPISLAVNTVKIPGQDTNVNLLAAGGYYTALGVR